MAKYHRGSGIPPLEGKEKQSRDGSATLSRHNRKETDRFKPFTYEELVKRDKVNLDIFWLKDDALEESANLPPTEVLADGLSANGAEHANPGKAPGIPSRRN